MFLDLPRSLVLRFFFFTLIEMQFPHRLVQVSSQGCEILETEQSHVSTVKK